jgi:hypothetical protein
MDLWKAFYFHKHSCIFTHWFQVLYSNKKKILIFKDTRSIILYSSQHLCNFNASYIVQTYWGYWSREMSQRFSGKVHIWPSNRSESSIHILHFVSSFWPPETFNNLKITFGIVLCLIRKCLYKWYGVYTKLEHCPMQNSWRLRSKIITAR